MKFILVWRTKQKAILELEDKYLFLISKFSKYEIEYIKEESFWEIEKIKNIEWEKILSKIKKWDYIILLDVLWKHISSYDFANHILTWQNNSLKPVFVIAWTYWASEELKSKSNFILSFSKLTFTHEIIRIMLFEQVFRAFSIIKNTWYHK